MNNRYTKDTVKGILAYRKESQQTRKEESKRGRKEKRGTAKWPENN